MRLTLGSARSQLDQSCVPAGTLASATLSAKYINFATKSIINSGKWVGLEERVALTVYDNRISLPRKYVSAEAASIQGEGDNFRCAWSYPIVNQWFEFIAGGPGLNTNPPYDTPQFQDLGSSFVVFRPLPSAGTLKITTSATETASPFLIRGFSGGQKVYSGTGTGRIEGVTLTVPVTINTSVATTQEFDAGDSLYSIVKPTTNGVLTFTHVATVGGTETVVGRYEPGETLPAYRSYRVPLRCNNSGQVVALCKVQQVDVVVDNDEIYPGNINALEDALRALAYRRNAEDDRAETALARSIRELNNELGETNSVQSWGSIQIDPSVGFGNVPNLV